MWNTQGERPVAVLWLGRFEYNMTVVFWTSLSGNQNTYRYFVTYDHNQGQNLHH